MFCLDTYALIEIANSNPKFAFLIKEDFVIPSTTLAEFFWVLKRDKQDAYSWIAKLIPFCVQIPLESMIKAQEFRFLHRSQNLSFFDAAGYVFSLENDYVFVTGDKEFRNLKGVRHITK